MRFNEAWSLTLRPSRLLLTFISGLHLLALLTPWFIEISGSEPIDGILRLALSGLMIASWLYYSRLHGAFAGIFHHNWINKRIASHLVWREFDGWELSNGRGENTAVILQNNSFSSLIASVLNFRSRCGQHFTVIILPDNASLDCRKHLHRRMKGQTIY